MVMVQYLYFLPFHSSFDFVSSGCRVLPDPSKLKLRLQGCELSTWVPPSLADWSGDKHPCTHRAPVYMLQPPLFLSQNFRSLRSKLIPRSSSQMEPEGPLLCLQEPSTGPCFQPDESDLHLSFSLKIRF